MPYTWTLHILKLTVWENVHFSVWTVFCGSIYEMPRGHQLYFYRPCNFYSYYYYTFLYNLSLDSLYTFLEYSLLDASCKNSNRGNFREIFGFKWKKIFSEVSFVWKNDSLQRKYQILKPPYPAIDLLLTQSPGQKHTD